MAREFGRPSSFKRGDPSGHREVDSSSPLQPFSPSTSLRHVQSKRGSEILRVFPVLFVILLVLSIYTIFVAVSLHRFYRMFFIVLCVVSMVLNRRFPVPLSAVIAT